MDKHRTADCGLNPIQHRSRGVKVLDPSRLEVSSEKRYYYSILLVVPLLEPSLLDRASRVCAS